MKNERKHGHYYRDVSSLKTIDVYRVLELFGVTDQALGHAIKKLLVAGGRGHKDIDKDIQEAIDTLHRWQEMRAEDAAAMKDGTAKLDLAKVADLARTQIIGAGGVGAMTGAPVQPVPRNQIMAAPWINLNGYIDKPGSLLDDQMVKVKYRTGGEHIAAARDISWRGVSAYQVLEVS